MFDMFSEANKAAVQIREVYDAFVRQGFSPDQAFQLLTIVMSQGGE